MIFRIHSKLLELCVGRSVVVHLFSDGGFGFARELLGMWHESWRSGQTQEGCFFWSVPLTPSVCRLLIATNFFREVWGILAFFMQAFFCLCHVCVNLILLYHVMFTVQPWNMKTIWSPARVDEFLRSLPALH